MSIKPIFVNAIFKKQKLFEYRRVLTKFWQGDTVLVYESRSNNSIVGQFTVGKVVYGGADMLLALEKESSDSHLIKTYLDGSKSASAIEIIDPIKWKKSVKLSDFAQNVPPPQSYIFLEKNR